MRAATAAMSILLLGQAAAARAEPLTADGAMQRYRDSFRAPAAACTSDEREITVCGRRPGPDPNRLPLPVAPEPGARTPGEAPDQVAAAELGSERCTAVGRAQQCSGGLPVIPIAVFLVKAAVKAVKGDD